MPSPYRERALIQSNVDLRKERKMTLDKFRRKYLDQVRPTASMRALMPPSMDMRERARASHREASSGSWHVQGVVVTEQQSYQR